MNRFIICRYLWARQLGFQLQWAGHQLRSLARNARTRSEFFGEHYASHLTLLNLQIQNSVRECCGSTASVSGHPVFPSLALHTIPTNDGWSKWSHTKPTPLTGAPVFVWNQCSLFRLLALQNMIPILPLRYTNKLWRMWRCSKSTMSMHFNQF